MMKKWIALLLCTFALLVQAADSADILDLNKLLKNDQVELWKLNVSEFKQQFNVNKLLRYSNPQQTELRFYSQNRQQQKMSFCNFKVYEAIFSFNQDCLCRMYISLYNHGDAGDMEQCWFEELLKAVEQQIEVLTSKKADNAPIYPVGLQKLYEKNFFCKNYNLKLQWSSSITDKRKFKAEYIQLIILPSTVRNEPISVDKSLTLDDLKSRVQHSPDGDCFIDVPTVNQGRKGYCVPATRERLAKYFGSAINQHVFEQIFPHNTGATPTQIKAFQEVIGLTPISLYVNSDFSDKTNAIKTITMYNKEAVKAQKPTINPDQFIHKKGPGYKTVLRILLAMESEIYIKTKSDDKAGISKFKNDIISNINHGLPVCWTVRTGLLEHQQNIGLHRRLIVGYNLCENVMIYSDSWGDGENKKLSLEKAWAISSNTFLFMPKSIAASAQGKITNTYYDNDDDETDQK